jgi:hypothetical protein
MEYLVAAAIGILDSTIPSMNDERDSGLLAHHSVEDYGSIFGLEMPYGPLDTTFIDVQAQVLIRDDLALNFFDSTASQVIAMLRDAIFNIGIKGHESAPG